MTSPNEWWKEEPYAVGNSCDELVSNCNCYGLDFNVPLIIEEVKRREKKTAQLTMTDRLVCSLCQWPSKEIAHYCGYCGAKFE